MGRLFGRLLRRYDDREYVVRLKARFVAYSYITELLIILTVIVYAGYAHLHNPLYGYALNFTVLSALTAGFVLALLGFVLFVRGHYTLSANILLICGFATLWTITDKGAWTKFSDSTHPTRS